MAILWARLGVPRNRIRHDIETQFGYDLSISVDELRETYQYNETCQQTVPEAIRCFLEADGFEDAIRNAITPMSSYSDSKSILTVRCSA